MTKPKLIILLISSVALCSTLVYLITAYDLVSSAEAAKYREIAPVYEQLQTRPGQIDYLIQQSKESDEIAQKIKQYQESQK